MYNRGLSLDVAFIYVCDDHDGRGGCRAALFEKWEASSNMGQFIYESVEIKFDDYTFYAGLLIPHTCSQPMVLLGEYTLAMSSLAQINGTSP